jgi:hypothetical protein
MVDDNGVETEPKDGYIPGNQVFIFSGSGTTSGGNITINPNTTGTTYIPNTSTINIQPGQWITYNIQGVSCDPEPQLDLSIAKKDDQGHNCCKCREFFPYAVANRDDGTMMCYACRHNL